MQLGPPKRNRGLSSIFSDANPVALDLLHQLLEVRFISLLSSSENTLYLDPLSVCRRHVTLTSRADPNPTP